MSYVAISFPVSKGTPESRKVESLKLAKKFSKELGLVPGKDVQIDLIRESTYGVVLPADVDNAVIKSAKRFGGKVAPFVESDTSARNDIKEGTWINLPKAAAGVRWKMEGTKESDPQEGKILPGDYFVLGIEESNGGAYATLGRVDKLFEIGRGGKGQYIYNVDLDILAQSVAQAKAKTESKKTAKTESSEPVHDRSNEILDMLLENDPYVIRQERKEKAKVEAQEAEDNAEPSFEDMISASMNDMTIKNEPKTVVESEEATTETASDETTETAEDTTDEDDKQESDEQDDDIDPELFAETREIVDALEAQGLNIEEMSDEQLTEFISKMDEDNEEEPAEDETKAEAETEEPVAEDAEDQKPESDEAFEVS